MNKMNNKEILEKAIAKAEKNGFNRKKPYYVSPDILIGEYNPPAILPIYYLLDIIFSHDFVKAFFGSQYHEYEGCTPYRYCEHCSEGDCYYNTCPNTQFCWQRHLQNMVLESEPLKYLERYL